MKWSKLRNTYNAAVKAKKASLAAASAPKADVNGFDPNADISKMTLIEQILWNKKRMEWRSLQKGTPKKSVPLPKKKLQNAVRNSAIIRKSAIIKPPAVVKEKWISRAEREKIEEAKAKEESKNSTAALKEPEMDYDPNVDLVKMSLPEQLQWSKKKNLYM